MPNVRIKDQTTDTALTPGDYVIVDSESEGTRKYDLGSLESRVKALEEAEGSGLTNQEKNLILTLFSKAAYAEDDAKSAYDTLEGLWRVVSRTITYNLTNCISTSSVTSVENGKPYSTSLSAQSGFTITTATVTMGGTDVTASYYNNGSISIPQVTGDIVITASAVLAAQSITATYTQSGTVYDTDSLDTLRSDLVVTANYAGGTSETVTDYTLSGTLTEGTSTVTVSYTGQTATFSVTVTSGTRAIEWSGCGTSSQITITDNVLSYEKPASRSANYYQAWEGSCTQGESLHFSFNNSEMVRCTIFVYIVDEDYTILDQAPSVGTATSPVSGNLDNTFTWKTSSFSTAIGFVLNGNSSVTIPATGKVVLVIRSNNYLPDSETSASQTVLNNAITNNDFNFYIER